VPTLVLDPEPVEIKALVERRRRLGQDLYDEVWEGVLHMNPGPHGRDANVQQQLAEILGPLARRAGLMPRVGPFNIGSPGDYRVPGGGLHRSAADELYYPTAALAIEIVSPGDETFEKLPFYAAHGVAEVLIVDPLQRSVRWLRLAGDGYAPIAGSSLIELGPDALAERIDWPT
jgi:hypothetical protein